GGSAGRRAVPGHHLGRRGVRGPLRQAGGIRARAEGVRAPRPGLPTVPHPHRVGQGEQPDQLLLSAVPELAALLPAYVRESRHGSVVTGNPVWSMYQTDIIVYGVTLTDYLRREFRVPAPHDPPERPRPIRYWTDFIRYAASPG